MRTAMLTAFAVCLWSGAALAQESPKEAAGPGETPAPQRAWEIGLAGGYTQPFGRMARSQSIGDMVEQGGGVTLDVGYRFDPRWSFGTSFHFHESATDDSFGQVSKVRGVTAGLATTFHATPFSDADPFISLGLGYRMLWILPEDATDHLLHGFQLGRIVLGIDFRPNDSFSFGPQLGADMDLLVWDAGLGPLEGPRPITFVFAGIGGRLDIGGERVWKVPSAPSSTAVAER